MKELISIIIPMYNEEESLPYLYERLVKLADKIDKYNMEYSNLELVYNNTFHDRYIIVDKTIIYHLGASINYAGSKTFSINILEDEIVKNALINNIKAVQ